tara:strand:- start:7408 stop:8286 length:879 start_codon:yes stop_codon:yes gene_type:complete
MINQEFLASGGLDFTISKQKMYTEASNMTDYDETQFYATIRNDNKKSLGCVTDRYVVKQNKDLLDTVLTKIGEGNYDLSKSKCGAFKGGKKVFFFIKINNKVDFGQEMADSYIYAISSHDGSARLTFGISTELHSCSNMFSVLMADKDNSHTVKHTKAIEQIVNDKSIDDLISRNTKGLSRIMINMQGTEVKQGFINQILDLVGRVDGKKVLEASREKRTLLAESIKEECKMKGNDYYGVFNGVTHYLTHKVRERQTEEWFDFNLNGKGSSITTSALKLIVKQMKEDGVCLN